MTIYKVTCLITGKIYIGKDESDRNYYLGSGKYIKNAIKKYGKENFKKEILEICISRKQLCEREKFWIKESNSIRPKGYNISTGGDGGDTLSHHDNLLKIRRKISESHKGSRNSMFGKIGKNNPNYGRRNSPETIKRMSESKKGNTYTKGLKQSKEVIENRIKINSKPIFQFSIDGQFIQEWASAVQVKRKLGISNSHIIEVCKNRYGYKSAGGFIWKYKEQ